MSTDYPPINRNELNSKYFCNACQKLIRNAHQTDCGCRYCLECIEKQLEKQTCGQCGEPISNEVKINDRAFQKEINNMLVKCVDCDWTGKYIDYVNHYKKHETIKCRYCGSTFANEEILNSHLDEKTGDCVNQPMHCIYSDIGCSKNEFNRVTIVEHSKNETANHLKYVYTDLNTRVTKLENQTHSIITSRQETASNVLYNQHEHMEQTSQSLPKPKPKQLKDSDTASRKSKSEDNDVNSKMSMLEFNLKCVGEDLTKYVHFTEKLHKELDESKASEKKLKEEIDSLQKSLTFAQTTIISLEERLLAQEKASYNGMLVWKITNIRDKIQEAKSGRQTSIYSPPFYTHQNGFKMCGRIYLNGDGMGRNTHVSLFFVIMRGEYDALLRWPFRQKVTFMLMDQSNNESRENIIDAFRPDPNSNSFKRPTSDMNIASGIPLFCPLAKLHSTDHEYVKDDCMFIKIIVDSRDLIDI